MTEVGAYEAKSRLSEMLDRVARGERITITRHGVPVALLVPAGHARRHEIAETIAALKSFRKGRRLQRAEIATMIAEGRR